MIEPHTTEILWVPRISFETAESPIDDRKHWMKLMYMVAQWKDPKSKSQCFASLFLLSLRVQTDPSPE